MSMIHSSVVAILKEGVVMGLREFYFWTRLVVSWRTDAFH